jgi:hypothetical protein
MKIHQMVPCPLYLPDRFERDYWLAVTDVPCPCCAGGVVRWDEAGRVPGARRCDGCGQKFQAKGSAEQPTLVECE